MDPINRPADWAPLFPWPTATSHKHARGRLGVVSGAMASTGAARLAARAGLRAGAGLVKVFCPPDAVPVLAVALEAVMLAPFTSAGDLVQATETMDAMVIGPAAGLTEATLGNVVALGPSRAALVVDADALTIFKGRVGELLACLDPVDVLTPHEGEFERLFPGLLAEGRQEAAVEAARRAGAVVILKGAHSVIAAPDGRWTVNQAGTPWLATAGTGDVLAGITGALLAQGMPSYEAACAATWIHVDAARRFGPGLISEDLPDLLPAVLADLLPG